MNFDDLKAEFDAACAVRDLKKMREVVLKTDEAGYNEEADQMEDMLSHFIYD